MVTVAFLTLAPATEGIAAGTRLTPRPSQCQRVREPVEGGVILADPREIAAPQRREFHPGAALGHAAGRFRCVERRKSPFPAAPSPRAQLRRLSTAARDRRPPAQRRSQTGSFGGQIGQRRRCRSDPASARVRAPGALNGPWGGPAEGAEKPPASGENRGSKDDRRIRSENAQEALGTKAPGGGIFGST
jgi:hypothetical protein